MKVYQFTLLQVKVTSKHPNNVESVIKQFNDNSTDSSFTAFSL